MRTFAEICFHKTIFKVKVTVRDGEAYRTMHCDAKLFAGEEFVMKVVAVCACTVGIAHTWMAKEAIEKECERRGFEYKVEAQGGYGIENELEEDEIAEADAVLLAIAIGIEGDERFDEKRDECRVLTLDPSLAIADPAKVIDQVVALTQ